MMKSLRGSVFWMAPEVFHGNGYGKMRLEVGSVYGRSTALAMLTRLQ
jgi:hypothetical protein